jgi:hypothetical protein
VHERECVLVLCCSLEHNLQVLCVTEVIFRVICVWLLSDVTAGSVMYRFVGRELTCIHDHDGIDRYITVKCHIILDSVDCERERGARKI